MVLKPDLKNKPYCAFRGVRLNKRMHIQGVCWALIGMYEMMQM